MLHEARIRFSRQFGFSASPRRNEQCIGNCQPSGRRREFAQLVPSLEQNGSLFRGFWLITTSGPPDLEYLVNQIRFLPRLWAAFELDGANLAIGTAREMVNEKVDVSKLSSSPGEISAGQARGGSSSRGGSLAGNRVAGLPGGFVLSPSWPGLNNTELIAIRFLPLRHLRAWVRISGF